MQVTKHASVPFVLIIVPLLAALTLNATESQRDKGITEFENGRFSRALRLLQQAAKDPADEAAATFLALTQAATGGCKTALPSLAAESRKTGPMLPRLAGLAAVKCYSSEGDGATAFAMLDSLQRKNPDDADVLYTAAKLHMKAFNDATFAMFLRAPASYRVHELSAEIFEVQNRYSDAIPEYRKAIELNPKAPDLHYRLGRAILLQSHSPEAAEQAAVQFQAELQITPEDAACEFQLGQIARVQGNAEAAKSHFELAIAASPDFAEALVALGKLYVERQQYERAIAVLSRAAAVQPDNEAAHYALLTAYRDAGEIDKAKAEKATLDRLQKPPEGEFSDFLKKLGEKQPEQ